MPVRNPPPRSTLTPFRSHVRAARPTTSPSAVASGGAGARLEREPPEAHRDAVPLADTRHVIRGTTSDATDGTA